MEGAIATRRFLSLVTVLGIEAANMRKNLLLFLAKLNTFIAPVSSSASKGKKPCTHRATGHSMVAFFREDHENDHAYVLAIMNHEVGQSARSISFLIILTSLEVVNTRMQDPL